MFKYFYTIVSIIIAASIFLLSSFPHTPLPKIKNIDKIAHFIAFGILAGFTLGALRENKVRSKLPLWILSIILVSLWGAIDEVHQLYVPGRKSSLVDWIMDTLGAIFICFAIRFLMLKKKGEKYG